MINNFFDINTFLENINNYGTSSVNRFSIEITLPPLLRTLSTQNPSNFNFMSLVTDKILRYRATSTNIPGMALLTIDTNKFGVGTRIKQAYNAVPSDIRIEFLADKESLLESFFNTWINFIFNFGQSNYGASPNFLSSYREDIVSPNINITRYDSSGNVINVYNLYNAYPTIITPIQLNWEQQNTLVKFSVNFNTVSYTIN